VSVILVDDGPGNPEELGSGIREGRRSSWRVRRQDKERKEVVRASWQWDKERKAVVQARLAGG
jgi:transposase